MLKRCNIITYCLSLISMIILSILLFIVNVIPIKYLLLILLIFALLYLFLGVKTFKIKSTFNRVILIIFEVVLGLLFVWASNKIYITNDFLNKINDKTEDSLYYVIVLKDSKFNKLKDLNTLGTYSINDNNYQKAFSNINKKVSIEEKEYNDMDKLEKDLLAKKVDAILISDFNKDVLEEEHSEFEKKTKVIHIEKITKELKKETKVLSKEEPFNILISGIDTWGSINKVSRSDVNIVISINPQTNEILLTSIPRDYYVQLHGTTDVKDKLTHAGIYGIDMSVKTIEDLLDTKIDYYIRVNFDTLISVVDKIGGIEVYSDTAFTAYNGDKFVEGINQLDGTHALSYSRERKQFAEGDRKRGEHQEQVITAIIQKVSSSSVLLKNYSAILNSLEDSFQTSVPTSTIKSFVKYQLDKMPKWEVASISLDGRGDKRYTYSIPGKLLYVMLPDQTSLDNARAAINGLLKNKTLSELGL